MYPETRMNIEFRPLLLKFELFLPRFSNLKHEFWKENTTKETPNFLLKIVTIIGS